MMHLQKAVIASCHTNGCLKGETVFFQGILVNYRKRLTPRKEQKTGQIWENPDCWSPYVAAFIAPLSSPKQEASEQTICGSEEEKHGWRALASECRTMPSLDTSLRWITV